MTNRKFYKDAEAFDSYVHTLIKDRDTHYLILDEIQLVEGFEFVLNGFLYEKNLDIYVTGNSSKFKCNGFEKRISYEF